MHALLLLCEHFDSVGELCDSGVKIVITGVEFCKRFLDIHMEVFKLGIDKQHKIIL